MFENLEDLIKLAAESLHYTLNTSSDTWVADLLEEAIDPLNTPGASAFSLKLKQLLRNIITEVIIKLYHVMPEMEHSRVMQLARNSASLDETLVATAVNKVWARGIDVAGLQKLARDFIKACDTDVHDPQAIEALIKQNKLAVSQLSSAQLQAQQEFYQKIDNYGVANLVQSIFPELASEIAKHNMAKMKLWPEFLTMSQLSSSPSSSEASDSHDLTVNNGNVLYSETNVDGSPRGASQPVFGHPSILQQPAMVEATATLNRNRLNARALEDQRTDETLRLLFANHESNGCCSCPDSFCCSCLTAGGRETIQSTVATLGGTWAGRLGMMTVWAAGIAAALGVTYQRNCAAVQLYQTAQGSIGNTADSCSRIYGHHGADMFFQHANRDTGEFSASHGLTSIYALLGILLVAVIMIIIKGTRKTRHYYPAAF